MRPIAAFVLGLIVGWVIEWIIDWIYWRRRTAEMTRRLQAAEAQLPREAELDIVGGPVCIPYGEGVYRWWNVKTASGQAGWSSEGSLMGQQYFLEPLP